MEIRTCDHLKEDGFYCKSPALKCRNHCYPHLKLRGRRLNMARARALAADQPLDLPFPEDMHSIQVTLFELVNALVNKRIDHKTAGLALYAMQQASINLNNRHASQDMCQSVKPNEPMLALEFPDFEERYHLPKDIDLDADPDAPPPASDSEPEENPTTKTERPRADRIPLPKPLWRMKDPDAPFRAYTSDGRELTRQNAARWQKRIWQQMSEFLENGGKKDWDDGIDDEDVA